MTTPTYASPEEVAGKFDEKFKMSDTTYSFDTVQEANAQEAMALKSFIATQRREDLERHIAWIKGYINLIGDPQGFGETASWSKGRKEGLEFFLSHLTTLLAQDKK